MRNHHGKSTHISAGIAGIGLAVIMVGGFLPWFRSGSVLRDSYQTAGVVDSLFDDNSLVGFAMRAWLGVPLLCVVCITLYVLARPRTSAVLAIIVSLSTGTVGLLAYIKGGNGNGLVSAVPVGPLTTAVGGALVLLGALGVSLSIRAGTSARKATPSRKVA